MTVFIDPYFDLVPVRHCAEDTWDNVDKSAAPHKLTDETSYFDSVSPDANSWTPHTQIQVFNSNEHALNPFKLEGPAASSAMFSWLMIRNYNMQ